MTRSYALVSVVAVHLMAAPIASAQWLPQEPVRLLDGQLRVAGEVTATVGARDDDAFFNYTDYERNALRTVRLALTALWQPSRSLSFLTEVRSDDFEHVAASAAYVRLRPLEQVPVDIQAGRIPPVFGAFARQAYGADRLLIGYPLAYQYLTSLRADALPGDATDLLRMRGRGWRSNFPVGSQEAAPGLPLVSALQWDTGVEARWTTTAMEAAVSVTQGTLANPRLVDDNGSVQVAGRVAVRPLTGLVLGASAARGGWISDDVPVSSNAAQTALGADVEYSGGHWLVRGETIWSRWRVPFAVSPREGDVLGALATWVEGRYRLTPRLYVAARVDHLGFSHVTPAETVTATSWDAPVTRVEIGAGYSLQRNLRLRAVVQTNQRDGGRIRDRTFLSSQVTWWF